MARNKKRSKSITLVLLILLVCTISVVTDYDEKVLNIIESAFDSANDFSDIKVSINKTFSSHTMDDANKLANSGLETGKLN